MYDQPIDAPGRVTLAQGWPRSIMALAPLLVALGFVLFTMLHCPLKDDSAWLLYVAKEWLAGRRLYVDLIEINPPMIVWILALPAALAGALGVAAKFVAVPLVAVSMLASAGWCAHLLRGHRSLATTPLALFGVIGTVLLALPGPEFGQREHLLVAAALPYLCIFAQSVDGVRVRPADQTIAGILAGLGCALKPQFLIAFALLELVGAMWGLPLLRRMTVSAAATVLAYVAAVLLFEPAYFATAIPLGIALYGASDASWLVLVRDSRPVIFGEIAALVLWLLHRHRVAYSALPMTLAVFGAGSILVWFLEGKAWFYHRLPASVVVTLALIYWAWAPLRGPRPRRRELILAAAAVLAGLLGPGLAAYQRWQDQVEITVGSRPTAEKRLEQLIRRERAGSYIAFSEWIGLGFPVVNNTGVIWASRFDSMWALVGEVWRRRIDGHVPPEWPVHRWVVDDFLAACPDLAVVDERESVDYVGTLSALDPRFRGAWSEYRLITAFDGLRVFRRQASCRQSGLAADAIGVQQWLD